MSMRLLCPPPAAGGGTNLNDSSVLVSQIRNDRFVQTWGQAQDQYALDEFFSWPATKQLRSSQMQRRNDAGMVGWPQPGEGAVVQLVADDIGLECLNPPWLVQHIVDAVVQQ
jgi:hypothetical protein